MDDRFLRSRAVGLVVIAAACLLGGCGAPSARHRPAAPTGRQYLAALNAEQRELAAAERGIARHTRSRARLSRAIGQLAGAIRHLGRDLVAIRPPPSVAALHARLLATVRRYAHSLETAAGTADRVGGELRASRQLVAATDLASREFTQTMGLINHALRRSAAH